VRQRLLAARRGDQGFTLTELLIVIVILGILAGVVVFAVTRFSDDAKASACTADKKSIEVAVDAYKVKNNGAPPPDINTLYSQGYIKATPVAYPNAIAMPSPGVVTGC
jgi:general secretion pathway protein G